MKSLEATIVRDVMRETTEVRITITGREQIDCPPTPRHARFGDYWMHLTDGEMPLEMGYWDIDPEGTAMYLLRAAWVVAHQEQAARNRPFDGDPRPMWEK